MAATLVAGRPGSESRSLLNVIIDETNRLGGVLEQFLDFARPYEGAFQSVALPKLFANLQALLTTDESTSHLEFEIERPETLPAAYGDDQLYRVLLNLVRNGTQALTPDGGKITVGARIVTENPPGQVTQNRRRIEVYVTDTGPGISPDVQQEFIYSVFHDEANRHRPWVGNMSENHAATRNRNTRRLGFESRNYDVV